MDDERRFDEPTRRFLAATNEVVIVFDRELLADYVSPSVERVLGVTPVEVARCWRDLVHELDLADVDDALREVMATPGADTQMRMRARRGDGELRIFDTVIANRLEDHTINGVLVSARDVTELVRTEERLGRSEAYFEAIVEASPDAFLLLDAEGIIRFASAGISDMLGVGEEDVVGRSPLEFVLADDTAFASAELAGLLSSSGRSTHVVLELRRADGGTVWAEISSRNHLDRPGLRSIVTTVRDVTARIEEELRMERLMRDASSASFVVDRDLLVTWRTPGVERFIGPGSQLHGDAFRELFDTGEDADFTETFDAVVSAGPDSSRSVVGRLEVDATRRWFELSMSNALDDPTIEGVIVTLRDVDDAVRAREVGDRLSQVLGSTTDIAFISDADSNIIWANPAAVDVYGEPPVLYEDVLRRTPDWALAVVEREVRPALEATASWRGELGVLTDEGEEVPIDTTVLVHRDRDGTVGFTSVFARDLSERKVLEERLHAGTRTDPLTGLPNRATLTEALEALLRDGRTDTAVAVIDLDQFKGVNNAQGHVVGDQLLVAAADRLRSSVDPTELVGRFGGDEFVVVLTGVDDVGEAEVRVQRVLAKLRGLVSAGTIDVFMTASAGVALTDGASAAELISNAETAMYAAKSAGRDRAAVFSGDLRERSIRRLEITHDLRTALSEDGLELWYQPIVTTEKGLPVGLEALVRWRHPVRGLLSPAEFVPIAEETGLIVPLGAWVIRQACAAVETLSEGADVFTVSVNISAYQLADPELPRVLAECMEEHSVPAGRLTCEITESTVMRDVTMSVEVLDRIRELGVGIAVDDFGTGYSSLAYLRRFPVDVLKIDREFIIGLTADMDWKHSLAAGIVSLAHSLDLMVVAEGVETEEQADILSVLGCDALQGFLFGRPTPVREVPDVLGRLRSAADQR